MVFRYLMPALAFDFDVLAFRASVQGNGATVSDERMAIINTFVTAQKTAGIWGLLDDYWSFWAENATQALTSLKQRRLATVVAAPTFTADRDYALNGSTQYIDTGFIPGTHGINCTGADQRVEAYERTNVSSSGVSIGTVDAAARCLLLINRNGTVATGRTNAAGVNFTLGVADSRGLKSLSRAGGGTTMKLYDRGVKLTDGTATSPGAVAPTRSLYIGAVNNAGTAATFRAASIGFASVGAPLSDTQESAHYAAVQAFATSVGANV
jgi:hypothetical protein